MKRLSSKSYTIKMNDGQWALVVKSHLQKERYPDADAAEKAWDKMEGNR